MSIPPLVCSTPPPPDQCEDDKDPEDFDIQYHLSQDDEDDNYDFGSFSTFDHFQSSQNKQDPTIDNVVESKKVNDSSNHVIDSVENDLGTNIISESKLKFDEETNIEDLDLKLDQETLERADIELQVTDSKDSSQTKESVLSIDPVNEINISDAETNVNSTDSFVNALLPDEIVVDPLSLTEDPPSYVDDIIAAVDNLQITPTEPEIPSDFTENLELNVEPVISEPEKKEVTVVSGTVTPKQIVDDDDFGDFDNFHYAPPLAKPATLEICDNPWDRNAETTDNDFGDFKASFDNNLNNTFSNNNIPIVKTEHSTEIISKPEEKNEKTEMKLITAAPIENDFEDFPEFRAHIEAKLNISEEEKLQSFQLLDLQSEQLIDDITKVINNIFLIEIATPEEECQEKLESVLGQMWGHILDVDNRQPYMVNWNNSLGQKTLLKALCIDSRNILFGPKWNYSMPKYAATLTAAPLQPQKQVATTSTSQSEIASQEKPAGKLPGTWNDPFTSDGQEFTYAEALLLDLEHIMATLDQMAHSHSTVKISELLSHACNPDNVSEALVIETGPTDLDVFEASTSTKPDKIFSSTLNIQPLRQISLPDTHIFTPTDSEIPRSTTIHYDNRSTVLLPQTVIETSKSEPSFKTESQSIHPQPSTSTAVDSDEYWEFQDFKGPTTTIIPSAVSEATDKPEFQKVNPNATYGTQVLQPIKVEPVIPTLNWPDPGEVKETFDDFSDFVSSTASINQQQQTPSVPVQQIDSKPQTVTEIPESGKTSITPINRLTKDPSGDYDDDFSTFQSALPSTSSGDFKFTSVSKVATCRPDISPQAAHLSVTDFDFTFPKVENVKFDATPSENTNKPKDNIVQNQLNFFTSNTEVKSPPAQAPSGPTMGAGLLQPKPAGNSAIIANQQKSTQILQPLSLESFSQINWPNPGIDLQDLSRFNPVETLNSLKSDLSVNQSQSKVASPVHNRKSNVSNQLADDDWGEFVSSKPKPQQQQMPKKQTMLVDDDEWTDFVSSPSVKPQNGLNTISFNVHTNTNLTIQKPNPSKLTKSNKLPLEIPSLNYITPKTSNHKSYNDRHFQNL